MKIAILFFGRMLHYEKRFLFKYLSKKNKYDVFISSDGPTEKDKAGFNKLYNPVATDYEPITSTPDFSKYEDKHAFLDKPVYYDNMKRHFINLKRVFNLLNNHIINTNTKYDIIIKARLDLRIGELKLSKIPLAPNTLYIPAGGDYEGIYDRFAYGDFEAIKKHMNIIDNITLFEDLIICFGPEHLTMYNIMYTGLNVKRFKLWNKIKR